MAESDAVPPRRIAGFRIVRLLGAGGMGAVYEAEQEHPRRPVALKLLERGLTSPSALRRFEVESQTLARMRHPGIAQVYDAGTHTDETTGASVPWFAMEYITNARSLTEHARAVGLDLRAKLELFCKVCDAVQHGHANGVIHRDLKPANILVDSYGQPKIIDFGVARAADRDLAPTAMQTEAGQLLGTVPYMSPEQCAADPHDIDTRSDIYALGVVLYELLSGRMPYAASRTNVAEIIRAIREDAPERLSSTDTRLRGDVETIVHKALAKERERRYASASELASDIQRWLKSEPIMARPPSVGYQLRIFAKRNKAFVAAVAAVFLALVIGLAVANQQAHRARGAETAALYQKEGAEAVNAFYESVLGVVAGREVRGSADVATTEARIQDLLKSAEREVAVAFPGRADLEVRARRTLAFSFLGIGLAAEAKQQLRAAVELARAKNGPGDVLARELEIELGGLLVEQAPGPERREGLALLESARDALVRARGTADAQVLLASWWIGSTVGGERGEKLLREALAASESSSSRPHVVRIQTALARILSSTSRHDEALQLAERALGHARENRTPTPDLCAALSCKAQVLHEAQRLFEALVTARGALDVCGRVFGKKHALYGRCVADQAEILWESGQRAEARLFVESYREDLRARAGDDAFATLDCTLLLSRLCLRSGQHERALDLAQRALDGMRRTTGDASANTLRAAAALASVHAARGRLDEAEAIVCPLLATAEERGSTLEDARALFAGLGRVLGRCLTKRGRYDEAEDVLLAALRDVEAVSMADLDGIRAVKDDLCRLYDAWRKPELAEKFRAVELR